MKFLNLLALMKELEHFSKFTISLSLSKIQKLREEFDICKI